ncbi:NACHT domain-containing protein [Ohtaekwangia koreensis]|uniref:NACHT domain-containing protein n=1 Tax=Ohtaekwangia koreensis TaxID=688867 RepID=A0A1T5MLI9_9BACT|nr:NACHT domain-containing protein [Ohtaekwangia koreensis]SKC88854.1 NACHT domain-containing protein [Ohtaekwangia koreensis]
MIKKEINFSDLIDFFKKNQVPVFDDDIDKFGGYFITAARIVAVIIAPDPVSKIGVFCAGIDAASLRVSKLFSWLPDKFKYRDRERTALQKYELAAYVNFILMQIAIKNGVKEIIMPHLEIILKGIELSAEDKIELEKKSKECDKEREILNVQNNCALSREDINSQSNKIIDPIFSVLNKCIDKGKETVPALKKFDSSKMKEALIENVSFQYHAFLINFSGEFPEFTLWVDVTLKAKIIKELKDSTKAIAEASRVEHEKFVSQTEKLLKKIEELRDNSFIRESGFPSFMDVYETMFKVQEEHLSKILKGKTIENIAAHQNQIKSELIKPLSDNTDVEQIVYPLNKNIFISQSFEAITYRKKEHRKGFLTADSLGEKAERGENIGNYLLRTLVDPNYATRPIILLGNPGAGKSMLSKMFAGLLCETNDFIPFLIKLRSVASSSASISEHINKGLQNSIENTSDVNWLEWAKEFRNRIPVIIMDGFDELMQTSNRELNGYVDAIREFQEKAINSGICVRIILTSRVTVMQDVSIPEYTKIIKLDSFDGKRRDLWIRKWNDVQKKPKYKFVVPKNDKIELLAKEPLLMFMLAVYDFENGELQNILNDRSFNQSKLYDSLLDKFIKRQLVKNLAFKDAANSQKEKEEELFRLRLGMIALMMFMNDTTSRDTQKLLEEMTAFGIHKSSMQAENILGGFFFIHENKSTTESDVEKFNYEFLHKTFGEFLTADFMLRVAKKQKDRMIAIDPEIISQKETFNFCFGYNWLHKHNNIQNFLFEHARQVLKPDSNESKIVLNLIKTDLKYLFDKGHREFPVTTIRLLENKNVIEHLGIYSQNIVFLWLAIVGDKHQVKFEIFDVNENIGEVVNEPRYESQDRDEINKNKLLWKHLAKLWALVGNYSATAKLTEWIAVSEIGNVIELRKTKSKVTHNFFDSANVGCNDFELLLSYFDNEYKFSHEQNPLQVIERILEKKPELFSLAVDVVLHRFHDLYSIEGKNLLEWFGNKDINRKQQIAFIKKAGLLKGQVDSRNLIDLIRLISEKMQSIFMDNIQAGIEYLKILVDLKAYFPLAQVVHPEVLDDLLRRFSRDFGRHERESPLALLEYFRLLNKINEYYPFRHKFKVDYMEEALHRLTRDMRHYIRDNSYLAFEYLKLLNELRQYYPIRKMHPDFLDESIHIFSKNIRSLVRENPQAILEYLKLLNDMKENFPFKEKFPYEFLIEAVQSITEEWEVILLKNEDFSVLDYLKIISEFSKHYSINEIVPDSLIRDAFHRLSKDLIYIIRDRKQAYEYLQIVKQFCRYYSSDLGFKGKIIDEHLFRVSKEMDVEFRDNPDLALIFFELLLINQMYHTTGREKHMIERLVDTFRERDYHNNVLAKAAVILVQYNAPISIIERLLDNHAKFKDLFSKSPEIAKDILEATADLNNYERFN